VIQLRGSGLRAVDPAVDVDGEAALQLLAAWATAMRANGLAERTLRERPRVVRAAAALIGVPAHQLASEQLIDYLAELTSAGTRQTYYSALQAWHTWLVLVGAREDNPMASMRRPKAPRRDPKPVATAHIERLLASGIRRRTRTIVLLCAYQGMRVHEAAKIRGQDVDLVAGTLRIVGKGGVDELVPLHPTIADEAANYPRRGYWFPSHTRQGRPIRSTGLSSTISRAMARCGVPGTAHSLRHWLATELVREEVNARVIQTIMRHKSLATLAIYTRVDRDQQRAALNRLPAVVLPPDVAV
jgi:site-specific recombinase XerD